MKGGIEMFKRKSETVIRFVIDRKQVTSELKRFTETESYLNKYSIVVLDFMKETLFPIKAKLIQGIQDSSCKNDINMDDNVLKNANECLEYLQKDDLASAYRSLVYFFDFGHYTYCSYNEILTGLLLVNALLAKCNCRIREYAELQKRSGFAPGKKALEALSDVENNSVGLISFEAELRWWCEHRDNFSLQSYFGLSDKEYCFLKKSFLRAFKTIVISRHDSGEIHPDAVSESS